MLISFSFWFWFHVPTSRHPRCPWFILLSLIFSVSLGRGMLESCCSQSSLLPSRLSVTMLVLAICQTKLSTIRMMVVVLMPNCEPRKPNMRHDEASSALLNLENCSLLHSVSLTAKDCRNSSGLSFFSLRVNPRWRL